MMTKIRKLSENAVGQVNGIHQKMERTVTNSQLRLKLTFRLHLQTLEIKLLVKMNLVLMKMVSLISHRMINHQTRMNQEVRASIKEAHQ